MIPQPAYLKRIYPDGTRPSEDVRNEVRAQAWWYYNLDVDPLLTKGKPGQAEAAKHCVAAARPRPLTSTNRFTRYSDRLHGRPRTRESLSTNSLMGRLTMTRRAKTPKRKPAKTKAKAKASRRRRLHSRFHRDVNVNGAASGRHVSIWLWWLSFSARRTKCRTGSSRRLWCYARRPVQSGVLPVLEGNC